MKLTSILTQQVTGQKDCILNNDITDKTQVLTNL